MRSLAFIILVIAMTSSGCSKGDGHNESILYGTWVKGSNYSDTLRFMRKYDRNVLIYMNDSYLSYHASTEVEYIFKDNKLTLISSSSLGPVNQEIRSFAWTRYAQQFKITSIDLYPYLSFLTDFTYKKIN